MGECFHYEACLCQSTLVHHHRGYYSLNGLEANVLRADDALEGEIGGWPVASRFRTGYDA